MSQHEFIFRNLPPMQAFHFTFTVSDDRAEQRHAEIIRRLDRIDDSAGDKAKMRALGKEADATTEALAEAIPPATP